MNPSRNILFAFIASPGDVADERRAAREVVEDLNNALRKINWQIDLLGWEDTLPGAARPQELINKDVDACSLFIGLLWKRWGQPTGEYSSGFEEEFVRAVNRRQETGSPEIWLSFKQIDPDLLKDPGEQLSRVWEFRQEQEKLRQVLFKEFTDVEEWRTNLRNWLLQYVLELERLSRQMPEAVSNAAAAMPAVSDSATSPTLTEEDKQPGREQLVELLNSIRGTIEGHLERSSLPTDQLDPFQIVRNLLFSMTLMSSQTSSSMLGVHEMQRLYLYRERLEAISDELMLLFRTILDDENDLVPGWYWFSWLGLDVLRNVLLQCATRDSSISVRRRAWETLAMAHIPPVDDAERWKYALRAILSDEEALARRAGLSYLGAIGTEQEMPTIEAALNDDRDALVRREASISRLLVLARTTPDQVFAEPLPDLFSEKRKIIAELRRNAERINKDTLKKGVEHTDEDIRLLTLEELNRKGELTIDIATSRLKDSSGKVSELCHRYLIERGEKLDPLEVYLNIKDETYNLQFSYDSIFRTPPYADPEAVILEIYRGFSTEDLWKLVDWESPIGHVAYAALARYHFDEVSARIRADLSEDFKTYEERFLEIATAKWEEIYSKPEGSYLRNINFGFSLLGRQQTRNEEEYTPEASAKREVVSAKNKYVTEALAGIVVNGTTSDAEFGRKYLLSDDYNTRLEAIRIIGKFGNENDVLALIDIVKTTEGILQEAATRAALGRTSDIRETARNLLLTSKEVVVSITIGYLLNERNLARTALFLEPFLLEKNDDIRKNIVAFFAIKLSEEELTQLLQRYTGQITYYYDVVCWLDRILYAPQPLKEMYRKRLENEIIQELIVAS